jgi:Ca2+-binding EF-hand superfamily protein
MRILLMSGFLAVALLGTMTLSGADTRPVSFVMARIDPDADGLVSVSEARNVANARFTTLDTDGDSQLNGNELVGIVGREAIAAADTDHDGMLSRSEYMALVMREFKKADTDKDGMLDKAELSTPEGHVFVALLAY